MEKPEAQGILSLQHDSLLQKISWAGNTVSAHAATLNRATDFHPAHAGQSLLQLQRQYGNQYVRRVLAQARKGESEAEAAPEVQRAIQQTRGGGQPLDSGVRAQMEPAFGADFSGVRMHADAGADALNRSLNARAFTTGQNVFFRQGAYSPGGSSGRELLAHELTHVVQQNGGQVRRKLTVGQPGDRYEQEADRAARAVARNYNTVLAKTAISPARGAERLFRATFGVGSVTVQVNYGNLTSIPVSDYESEIETRFASWAGSPATAIHSGLTALNSPQKKWVLYALDLLVDNTTSAHSGLDRVDAVRRLIAHAPSAAQQPLSTGFAFENEALRVSGWFEVALAAPLTAPTGATLATITGLYNPPPGPSAPSAGTLDVARLQNDIPPALTTLLNAIDPQNWPQTGTQPLSTLQTIADPIQAEARTFFSPYADRAITNAYSRGWQYSTHLFSVTATTPTQSQRIGYLLNRAEKVGRKSRPGGSIFSNANYDSSRSADRTALLNIVTALEINPAIRGVVNRLIQHTGRTERATHRVGISTEFNLAARTECQARWGTIEILAHELVHELVHPNFPARASSIRFGQIVREGFTEVLGVQLHDHLRNKAGSNAASKTQMEAGISAAPCPAPAAATVGYGQAGSSAEQIRTLVGNNNFRAAYFLGAVNLVGL